MRRAFLLGGLILAAFPAFAASLPEIQAVITRAPAPPRTVDEAIARVGDGEDQAAQAYQAEIERLRPTEAQMRAAASGATGMTEEEMANADSLSDAQKMALAMRMAGRFNTADAMAAAQAGQNLSDISGAPYRQKADSEIQAATDRLNQRIQTITDARDRTMEACPTNAAGFADGACELAAIAQAKRDAEQAAGDFLGVAGSSWTALRQAMDAEMARQASATAAAKARSATALHGEAATMAFLADAEALGTLSTSIAMAARDAAGPFREAR